MDVNGSARAILEAVGGAGNVTALQHCSTRLRFSLADTGAADVDRLRAVPCVLGVVTGPQTQIIIGSKVIEVHRALTKLTDTGQDSATAEGGGRADGTRERWSGKRVGRVVMDFVVSVFTPVVPAIAGAGVLKSLLVLCGVLGWMDKEGQNYLLLAAIPDAVFAFLPLLVAYTTAKKLNVNRPVAISAVGVLLFPAFTALIARDGGVSLFGVPVTNIGYSSQVFPAILSVLLLWAVERAFQRITPGPIRVFFVPMMCFLIVVPVTMVALGPLGYGLGTLLTSAMLWMHQTLGWVAVALLAALLPFVISVGMHKAFLPPTLNQVGATGAESLYLPASLAHNLSECGATLGVALRTKRAALRATSVSASVSALFGITEPALYGVTLQNRRTMVAVVAGSLSGGAYVGLTHVSAHAVVGPGLASMSMFANDDAPMNIVNAFIGFGIAFAVSFLVSLLTWKDSTAPDPGAAAGTDTAQQAPQGGDLLVAPMSGTAIPLAEVDDPVFSSGTLGEGIAIVPASGRVLAPVGGTVTSLLPSRHAIGITTDSGAEVLVHIGVDTVKLAGEHFTAHIAQGDRVEAGRHVLDVDLDAVRAAGYDTTTPVVVVNAAQFSVADLAAGPIETGAPLATVRTRDAHEQSARGTEKKELTHGTA
ncbi:beta-glucoside-specific PTS transporter subunit IIABC [Streptomyces sp. NPDC004111]|uniref:beta-glucoside-specific PTS transporter subunit IIABC n=1 Tax=Streptomyces sp. NPDC004111 TaxID=3364690 RepID=UPI0036B94288